MHEDVRAAAARARRTPSGAELLASLAFAELVDRLPRARVHVGARARRRSGSALGSAPPARAALRLGAGAGSAPPPRRASPAAPSAGDGDERRPRAAAAQERPQPETAEQRARAGASLPRDATLPPLLATPVAPSPEAASRRRGRLSPWEGGDSGCERLRDHAAAGPRARRGARRTRSSSASATRVEGDERHAGTATSRGAAASSPTRSTTRARRSTTCSSSRAAPETLAEITRVLKITDGVDPPRRRPARQGRPHEGARAGACAARRRGRGRRR